MNPNAPGRRVAILAMASISVFLVCASLTAQEVPYTTPGIISLTGTPMIYNGKYVLQKTDFGFLWLDTTALQPGMVQVEAKCGLGQPYPDTGIFVLGDCNGITNISSSGNTVLARQYSGQCGAATQGCGGFRVNGTGFFAFRLGTWEYLGEGTDIPDSTQSADLQGRTWLVQAMDTNGRNFKWKATVNPNAPPTANATATNLSAASRTDKTDYYGDKWQLQDASVSGMPITRIDWDFKYTGSFSPNEVGPPAIEATVIGYYPCDPSGPTLGNIRTGANCIQSLSLTNPAAPNSYRFAMQSANTNGTSASPYFPPTTAFVCAEAFIASYTGFNGTCAKTSGTLNVLIGGSADASASEGNLPEATSTWAFTGSTPITVQGINVPVPVGATAFTLTIAYPGGYKATAQGNIVQTSLVAAFSLAPDPVLVNLPLTLTNEMQKTGAITINSVNYVLKSGPCNPSFNAFTSAQLSASFLAVGGTATVLAPATTGAYCAQLKYNYTALSQPPQSQTVWNPMTVASWTPSPQIAVSPVPFCSSSCQLQSGTSYNLSDAEEILVSPHPGAQWNLVSQTGTTLIGNSSDASNPIVWTPAGACSPCTLRLTVNGVSTSLPVVVSGPVLPTATPTPPPTPTPTPGPVVVTAQGPSAGPMNVPLTYAANASGGTSPYSFAWACNYGVSPVFTGGGPNVACTYTAGGPHTVKARVTDFNGTIAYSSDFPVQVAIACGPFTDISDAAFCTYILGISNAGITTGCTPTAYCPDDSVFRLQMAIFLARAQAGGDANVPTAGTAQGQAYNCTSGGTSLFADVAASNPFCRHVHYIYSTGVTTGCSAGNYCPNPVVSRGQMAMFMARAVAGGDAAIPQTYGPDPATGRSYSCSAASPNLHFTDVQTGDTFCRHAHYLWAKNVVSGFPDNTYGPSLNVTRSAMAKFLANGFNISTQ